MISAPKCFVLGADDSRRFTLLYSGDDVQTGLDCFEKHPKEIHQIFLFRNGTLLRTKATPTAIAIRRAEQDAATKASQDAYEKALAAAKAKKDKDAAAAKAAQDAAAKKIAEENAKRDKDRAKRDADLLSHAADQKRAQAGAPEEPSKHKAAKVNA